MANGRVTNYNSYAREASGQPRLFTVVVLAIFAALAISAVVYQMRRHARDFGGGR